MGGGFGNAIERVNSVGWPEALAMISSRPNVEESILGGKGAKHDLESGTNSHDARTLHTASDRQRICKP